MTMIGTMIGMMLILSPAEAQTLGKWLKCTAFPERSEAGGKFYVLGGFYEQNGGSWFTWI